MGARPIPAELREKLRPILALCSSDKEGEASAALAALQRILKKNGFDWHDFTSQALDGVGDPKPDHPHQSGGSIVSDEMDAFDLLSVVRFIHETSVGLSPNSLQFLASMEALAQKFDFVKLSPKQQKWLRDLHRAAVRR